MSPRSVALVFPDRETAYWYTDQVFAIDDMLRLGGARWVVTRVSEAVGVGGTATVVLHGPIAADGDGHTT